MGDMNAYRILMEKSPGKIPPTKKETEGCDELLKEIVQGGAWLRLALDRVHWLGLVLAVLKLRLS
jgi:hypothetical protein